MVGLVRLMPIEVSENIPYECTALASQMHQRSMDNTVRLIAYVEGTKEGNVQRTIQPYIEGDSNLIDELASLDRRYEHASTSLEPPQQ